MNCKKKKQEDKCFTLRENVSLRLICVNDFSGSLGDCGSYSFYVPEKGIVMVLGYFVSG